MKTITEMIILAIPYAILIYPFYNALDYYLFSPVLQKYFTRNLPPLSNRIIPVSVGREYFKAYQQVSFVLLLINITIVITLAVIYFYFIYKYLKKHENANALYS